MAYRNRRNRLSEREETRLSKLLALLLRHQPEHAGVELDEHGAVDIDELADAVSALPGWSFLRPEHIIDLVSNCPRSRFQMDEKAHTVRASYGHSLPVPVVYDPVDPPARLYHGTSPEDAERIKADGLLPMDRQYVHLSNTARIAYEVGSRHAEKPHVLVIDAEAAHRDGIVFHRATDEVWLVAQVPAQYIIEWDKLAEDRDSDDDTDSDDNTDPAD